MEVRCEVVKGRKRREYNFYEIGGTFFARRDHNLAVHCLISSSAHPFADISRLLIIRGGGYMRNSYVSIHLHVIPPLISIHKHSINPLCVSPKTSLESMILLNLIVHPNLLPQSLSPFYPPSEHHHFSLPGNHASSLCHSSPLYPTFFPLSSGSPITPASHTINHLQIDTMPTSRLYPTPMAYGLLLNCLFIHDRVAA